MPTIGDLWLAQLQVHPHSVPVRYAELREWADQPKLMIHVMQRWRAIASALQHDRVVFYRLGPDKPIAGYRYGLEASQYASNFDCI